jgi:hypothetical protein
VPLTVYVTPPDTWMSTGVAAVSVTAPEPTVAPLASETTPEASSEVAASVPVAVELHAAVS